MKAAAYFGQADHMMLTRAILLYESNTQTLATVHDVMIRETEPPEILAGQCLTTEVIDELLRKLANTPVQRTLLPPEVLCDTGCLMWWKPMTRLPIFFNTGNAKFNKEVNGKEVLHPPLVFLAKPGRLMIFALSHNERPTPETMLYRAPYYNLYAEGAMCSGNVRLPEVTLPGDIPMWEKAFFETNFTHSNIGKGLTNHPSGHDGLWRVAKEWSDEPFVEGCAHARYLVPLKMTLQEAVNK